MLAGSASNSHPSALETFYDSWVKRPEPSLAERAERGARLAPITPCAHDAPLHFDEQGHGPFCTHCGDIVYHHAVRRHAAVVPLRGLAWDLVCNAVAMVQGWLMRPVAYELAREAYDVCWLAMVASYVGLGVFGGLSMVIQPVTWLDFVVFQANFMFITAAATMVLLWWAHLLPRRLLI